MGRNQYYIFYSINTFRIAYFSFWDKRFFFFWVKSAVTGLILSTSDAPTKGYCSNSPGSRNGSPYVSCTAEAFMSYLMALRILKNTNGKAPYHEVPVWHTMAAFNWLCRCSHRVSCRTVPAEPAVDAERFKELKIKLSPLICGDWLWTSKTRDPA